MHTFILVINEGSTSSKIAIYKDDEQIFRETIRYTRKELEVFHNVWEQYDSRKSGIIDALKRFNFPLNRLNVITSRGGTVKPIPGGIYYITLEMLNDIKSGHYGNHATNVGCQIAFDLAEELKIPAITLDPPVTDEMCELAKYSGLHHFKRRSSFHALSQKATARKVADKLGKPHTELNLIVSHLGGGISVGAHSNGQIIDVNNALDGDGPFSPERAGSLPAGDLIDLCFSGIYTRKQMHRLISGHGGLVSYLGASDVLEIEERIKSGDTKAKEVFEAMAYQVAKEIGAAAAILDGQVDAIALTGSLVYSQRLIEILTRKISFIAPIHLFPGENELASLAAGALRFMRGEEKAKIYNT